jgi:hemoglobin
MADSTSSLYDRIGGATGVANLIDQFYLRVFDDPELAPFFQGVPVDHLKTMQRELFSQALGGPFLYSGRPIREVHHGRGIKTEHLQRFVDHLLATLSQFDLTRSELDLVISRLNVDADKITGQSNVDG